MKPSSLSKLKKEVQKQKDKNNVQIENQMLPDEGYS
jgi:hypothetical protein